MPRLMITLTHLICCYKDGGRGAWVTPLPCQGIHNCSSFLHHLLCSSNWPVTSIKPSRKKESLLQHISTLTCLHGWPKREQDSQDILLPPQACWHLESVQSLSTGRLGNIGPITCPTFRPSAPFPVRTQTQVLVVKNFQPTMVFTLVISLALMGQPLSQCYLQFIWWRLKSMDIRNSFTTLCYQSSSQTKGTLLRYLVIYRLTVAASAPTRSVCTDGRGAVPSAAPSLSCTNQQIRM